MSVAQRIGVSRTIGFSHGIAHLDQEAENVFPCAAVDSKTLKLDNRITQLLGLVRSKPFSADPIYFHQQEIKELVSEICTGR